MLLLLFHYRYGILWRSRYHVWPRMEAGAKFILKVCRYWLWLLRWFPLQRFKWIMLVYDKECTRVWLLVTRMTTANRFTDIQITKSVLAMLLYDTKESILYRNLYYLRLFHNWVGCSSAGCIPWKNISKTKEHFEKLAAAFIYCPEDFIYNPRDNI